jgi:tetratricopeptide (TPR) repeat protein
MAEFGVTFDRPRLLREFRDSFRQFGWDVTQEPADRLADPVADSRARDKVLGLLFDWRFQAADPRQGNPAEGKKLEEVLRRVRQRAGGLMSRWQDVRDRGDLPGLVDLAADPAVTTLAPELLLELGRNLRAAGRTDAVLALLRRAADRYPTHVWVRHDMVLACREHRPPLWTEALGHAAAAATLRPDSAVFQSLVADALRQLGDYARAADADRRAVRLAPGNANLHNTLGVSLSRLRDLDGAAASFRTAIQLNPDYALAHFNLGVTLRAKGDLRGAAVAYREAIRLDPRDARPRRELAWLLAGGPDWLRDGRSAVEHATRACELTGWKDPVPIDTLAAGYAEAGNFEKAVEYEKMALSLPAFEKGPGLAARKRLDLYAQKRPYRDPLLARPELAPPPREVKGR